MQDIIKDFYANTEALSVITENQKEYECKNADDALLICLRNKYKVDLDYMSDIAGMSIPRLIEELNGKSIFPDPDIYERTKDYKKCFVLKQQFLSSGRMKEKYEKAKELDARSLYSFKSTISLLEEYKDKFVELDDIYVSIAAPWVPEMVIEQFLRRLLNYFVTPDVKRFDGSIKIKEHSSPNEINNKVIYGTKRMSALQIVRQLLKGKTVKVYDDYNGQRVLNKVETVNAQQKAEIIIAEWNNFIHDNPRIAKHIEESYAECFDYHASHYDGSFLSFPGLNPDITLKDHQKNAVARILMSPTRSTLLCHDTGAGKTYVFLTAVNELLRTNPSGSKAMIVLPNATFSSTVNAFKKLYLQETEYLVVEPRDFKPNVRKETIEEMKSDKYKIIFISFSSFDMIQNSNEYKLKAEKEYLVEYTRMLSKANDYDSTKRVQKKLRKIRENIHKLTEKTNSLIQDELSVFDMLGINILVVDECQHYKNISLDFSDCDVIGMHRKGAKKADNLLEKIEYIQSLPEHNVIFSSATVLSNSLADAYVWQRYLMANTLKECGIYQFNDWLNTFCEKENSFQVDVDSTNFRVVERYSKYHNLPELMSMFSMVTDFYQINDEMNLPEFKGYTNVVVPKSDAQKTYIERLVKRTEDVRNGIVDKEEDNLLKVTTDGRKAALDIRLVDDNAEEDQINKIKVCASKIREIDEQHPGKSQIVFCDIGTPRAGFNLYDDLKNELIQLGFKDEEVKFVHDANTESKRIKFERDLNNGKIKVAIGSTQKLGEGVNVQENLVALHNMSIAWTPSAMKQRSGRIIREGNTNDEVFIFRYVTEGSFDSYSWQLLENKQKFVSQFLSGISETRDETDLSEMVLDYGEIKALAIGNPLIKERVETYNLLQRAKIDQRERNKELISIQELLASLPAKKASIHTQLKNAKSEYEYYRTHKTKISNEERYSLGEEILYALSLNVMRDEVSLFDKYQGFSIYLPSRMQSDNPYVIVRLKDGNNYRIKMDTDKPLGVCKRIDYVLDHLEENINQYLHEMESIDKQISKFRDTINAGNEFDEVVDSLKKKLLQIDKELERV